MMVSTMAKSRNNRHQRQRAETRHFVRLHRCVLSAHTHTLKCCIQKHLDHSTLFIIGTLMEDKHCKTFAIAVILFCAVNVAVFSLASK